MIVCMGVGSTFSRGALMDFSKSVSKGETKSGEICFLPLETKKTACYADIFQFPAPFRHPYLRVGKISCQTIKKLV